MPKNNKNIEVSKEVSKKVALGLFKSPIGERKTTKEEATQSKEETIHKEPSTEISNAPIGILLCDNDPSQHAVLIRSEKTQRQGLLYKAFPNAVFYQFYDGKDAYEWLKLEENVKKIHLILMDDLMDVWCGADTTPKIRRDLKITPADIIIAMFSSTAQKLFDGAQFTIKKPLKLSELAQNKELRDFISQIEKKIKINTIEPPRI